MPATSIAQFKTFDQLSDAEKEKAIDHALNVLLRAVVEGAIRFNDQANSDDLQARIDQASAKAEKMQTPWFAHEYIMDAAGDDLRSMAECDAESALYATELAPQVIRGIA